jgi:hypothetical protein
MRQSLLHKYFSFRHKFRCDFLLHAIGNRGDGFASADSTPAVCRKAEAGQRGIGDGSLGTDATGSR